MFAFSHCRGRLVTKPSLPRIVEPLFSLYLLVLEIIFGLFLCLPYRPFFHWLVCPYHLSSHLQGVSVSKRSFFATLYNSTIKLIGIWGLLNV